MKAFDRAGKKERARMIQQAHADELAEFEAAQLSLFPPVFVVVLKRGDLLEDQRTFSLEGKARRFAAGMKEACALAHPGSTVLIAAETDGRRTYHVAG